MGYDNEYSAELDAIVNKKIYMLKNKKQGKILQRVSEV